MGVADHVMGVVHGAVSYLPEMVQYLSNMHPDLLVKAGEEIGTPPSCDSHVTFATGHLRKSEVQSVRMEEYAESVACSYCHGTFRAGPLHQVSLVGQVAEESGGLLPDVLGQYSISLFTVHLSHSLSLGRSTGGESLSLHGSPLGLSLCPEPQLSRSE